jgi:transcriptional regulator with XRE-family HTH domain
MAKVRGERVSKAFRERLGRHIAAVRDRAKLTQQQLADGIGVKVSSVSDWERGRKCPSVENLVGIVNETKADVAFLLSLQIMGGQKAALSTLSMDLGAKIGGKRLELLLELPDRRLQRGLDAMIGEWTVETAPSRPIKPQAR